MKQQNFLFVDLVSSIFLLVILIGNFMGLLYISGGSIPYSALGSIFLVICYFFVVQLLKKNKELMMKKNFLHGSILFWVFFLMLGFVSFFLMTHFINVEYNCKDQIKKEATRKIKLVDSLAAEYKKRSKEDVLTFEAELRSKLITYNDTKNISIKEQLIHSPYNLTPGSLLDNDIDVENVANAKVVPYQSKIENNIKNIDTIIKLNSKMYQSVFDNWKRLSLVGTYSKLNLYVEDNLTLINSKIAELPLNKTPINVKFNNNQIPLNNPIELNKIYPLQIAIPLIVLIIIHLFILIPFLSHKVRDYKRSPRNNNNNNNNNNNSSNIEQPVKKNTGTIEL